MIEFSWCNITKIFSNRQITCHLKCFFLSPAYLHTHCLQQSPFPQQVPISARRVRTDGQPVSTDAPGERKTQAAYHPKTSRKNRKHTAHLTYNKPTPPIICKKTHDIHTESILFSYTCPCITIYFSTFADNLNNKHL